MNSLYPIEKPAEPRRRSGSGAAWQHMDDVRRYLEAWDFNPTAPGVDCRVSANVGDIMAAAMAAAGLSALTMCGAAICETDYLFASGATFPATVTMEQIERFSHATLMLPDDVASKVRYEFMSVFWHPEEFEKRMAEIERMTE